MFSLICRNSDEGKRRECQWGPAEDGQGTGNNGKKNNVCVCVCVCACASV